MEELKRLREDKGWSQTRLAQESGVDRATINQVEGGRRSPTISTLEVLAATMDVEVADFFPKAQPPLPLLDRVAGQPDEERSAHDIARGEARRQYEIDRKAAARTLASEGIDHATRISDVYDPAVYDVLRHRPPGELAGTLLDVEQNLVYLEHEIAYLQEKAARLEEENAQLREERKRVEAKKA